MSLAQFCFSVRQAEAGLRWSPKKDAIGPRPTSADRVRSQASLRPDGSGHGSRFTAEKVRSVPSPSASERALTLGRMLPGNVFEANLNLPAGLNTVTIRARDGSGNEATKNYSVNVTGGAASYTYDANGNLKTKTEGVDVWVYEWNAMNQLIEVKKGTTVQNATMVATFKYDPIGRRIEKATPTKTVAYTYDGADILRENVTTSGSTVTSYYVHGPGIDEPLSKETGSSVTYYHADGLGSIAKETDGSGVVTNTLRYDAWGNIETGARDGFAFTGREWDPETGLYYYRARYYDARSGRFVAADPIGFEGGLNFYAYVSARPTNSSDPSGLVDFRWDFANAPDTEMRTTLAWAYAQQESLRTSLTPAVKQYFKEYFGKDLDALLRPGAGGTFDLTARGASAAGKNQGDEQWLNMDFIQRDACRFGAALLHEMSHDFIGLRSLFAPLWFAEGEQALAVARAGRARSPAFRHDGGPLPYLAEVYQFGKVLTAPQK